MISDKYSPTVDELIEELEKQKREIDEELTVLKRARGRVSPKEDKDETKSKTKLPVKITKIKRITVEDIAQQVLTQNSKPMGVSEIAKKAVELGIWRSKNPVQGMASALKRAEEKQCAWLGINRSGKRGTTRYYLKKED